MKFSWKIMAVLTVIVTALLFYGVYYTALCCVGMPTEEEIASALPLRLATMIVALIAWIIVGSSLTAWRYKLGKAEFDEFPESEKIMKRFEMIESKDVPELKAQTLGSMEALKKLADDYDLRIFHTKTAEGDTFFVTENNITYRCVAERKERKNT